VRDWKEEKREERNARCPKVGWEMLLFWEREKVSGKVVYRGGGGCWRG
jgi:hypothetical protein